MTSEGVRVPRQLQLRLQTFAHQRQKGARAGQTRAGHDFLLRDNTSLSTLTLAGDGDGMSGQ